MTNRPIETSLIFVYKGSTHVYTSTSPLSAFAELESDMRTNFDADYGLTEVIMMVASNVLQSSLKTENLRIDCDLFNQKQETVTTESTPDAKLAIQITNPNYEE